MARLLILRHRRLQRPGQRSRHLRDSNRRRGGLVCRAARARRPRACPALLADLAAGFSRGVGAGHSSVDEDGYIQGAEHENVFSPARIKGAALIVAVAVASLAYKLIFTSSCSRPPRCLSAFRRSWRLSSCCSSRRDRQPASRAKRSRWDCWSRSSSLVRACCAS